MVGLSADDKKKVMAWIWQQLKASDLQMPGDRLHLVGDDDLAYLYYGGFVDTDRYSYDAWVKAFRPQRQKDGSYRLSLEEWLEKTPYRYFGPIDVPFDVMTLREGEWSLDEYQKFVKKHILPEITVTYEQFLQGIEKSKHSGEIKNNKVIITPEKKEKLAAVMDKYASPSRRRALETEHIRRREELEKPMVGTGRGAQSAKPKQTESKKTYKSGYKGSPQPVKQISGKLSDLISGSKK